MDGLAHDCAPSASSPLQKDHIIRCGLFENEIIELRIFSI